MVKTLPSNVGASAPFLIRELRFHMVRGQKAKTWDRSNVDPNSMKTLKWSTLKKKKSLKNKIINKHIHRQIDIYISL